MFECITCKKQFELKANLSRHLNRKKKCKEPELNIEIIKCEYCQKIFTQKSSLTKHLISRCKIKDTKENNINITTNNNNNVINNITTNTNNVIINNNININIISFGHEDVSTRLNDEIAKSLIHSGFFSIGKLVEFLHFNKNFVDWQNVYMSNKRSDKAIAWNGSVWTEKRLSTVIELLDYDKCYLEEYFEKMKDTLHPPIKKQFERYMQSYMGNDTEKEDEERHELIKEVLYNNREIVQNTRQIQKEQLQKKQREKIKVK